MLTHRPSARPTGTDSARFEMLIVTEAKRGSGSQDDVHRVVREYWTMEGVKVAEFDPVFGFHDEVIEKQADT